MLHHVHALRAIPFEILRGGGLEHFMDPRPYILFFFADAPPTYFIFFADAPLHCSKFSAILQQ